MRVLAGILAAIAGFGIYSTFGESLSTDIIEFTVNVRPIAAWKSIFVIIPLEILLFSAGKAISGRRMVNILLPWLVIVPFYFFKVNIYTIIFFTGLTGLTLFRLLLEFSWPPVWFGKKLPVVANWKWFALLFCVTGLFVGQGIYVSHQAFVRQFYLFPDWGIFTEVAYNIFHRKFLWSYFQYNINFFQHHFEPGFFLVYAPLIGLFPSPYTTFAFSALMLWGSGLLIYWFARSRQLPASWSCGLALIYLFYPSVSNMNLCILYGFHEIYFFIPVFICFYVFYEKKQYWPAFFIFLFSLSIKETIGTLWLGWGICQFIGGERRWSVVYAICGTVYFLLCMKVIIPSIAGADYLYANEYYWGLGHNMREIIMSPFTRPDAFFGTLFRPKNFTLILLLLLPVFLLGFNRPLVMCGCFIQLLFICLFSLPSFINLGFHHQAETVILFNCATALGLAAIRDKGISPWLKIIARGVPLPESREQICRALLIATLATALLSNYFYAQSFYGCSNFDHVYSRPDYSKIMEEVKQIIPPDATVTAQKRPAGQLVMRNRVFHADHERNPDRNADYVFYDLGDSMPVSVSYHKNMLLRKEYGLIWMKFYKGSQFFIFKRGAEPKFKSPLIKMSDEAWNACGNSIMVPNFEQDFGVKVKLAKDPNGRIFIQGFIRILRPQQSYCNIHLNISDGSREYNWWVPFGYGVYPPFLAEVGDVFPLTVPVPADWTDISSVSVKFNTLQ
ncbi:MAG: DUF2079 domain-containing protein [Victivallaceae bacterium]